MTTILIVDDEPAITNALDHYFSQAGYQTILAHSGRAAIESLSKLPDLIILDLMLPDIDGYQVSQKIRTLPRYIPILMLTAKDSANDRILGLDTGADAYFTKPYNPQELLAQARALLRLSGKRVSEKTRCGTLELCLEQRTITKQGEKIGLTTIEFEILALLMQNPDQVFGRQTILRAIWGYNSADVTTRTIDTHIQRIRRKIEDNPKEPTLLLTVRGFGYRIMCPN